MTASNQRRPGSGPSDDARSNEQIWRDALLGTDPVLNQARRWWKRIPSDPRCKMCASPFGGIGSMLSRLARHGPMARNPLLCGLCARELRKHPGGAEIALSVLFADIRNSTRVAESMTATGYRNLLQRFYRLASEAITSHDGILDKYLGDGVMALFIPAFTGEGHAGRAVAAARTLREQLATHEPALPVGVGVHTGLAFAGAVGTEDELDFSALGDAVNVAARLGSDAEPGRILVSVAAADAAGLAHAAPDVRPLQLRGRSESLDVIEV